MLGGGGNSNPTFPVFLEENRFQHGTSALPQLQLFADVPVGFSVDPMNCMVNQQTAATNHPMQRRREPEPVSRQQKLHISFNNNFFHDEARCSASIFNPNLVSTGLRLSYEEDEHNSSVTSAGENVEVGNPGLFSISNSVKLEIGRLKEEFDHYIRLQEENMLKGVKELNQRHAASFLIALEKGVTRKLQERNIEIECMNRKNKELGEKLKQIAMEARSWHYKAKYNESVVNALKNNLQQVIAQGAVHAREGYGDSEEDDATSCTNPQGIVSGSGNQIFTKKPLNCKACRGKEVCILLLPCRHLCLCRNCEGFVDICPVCQVMKTASVQVFMS